MHLAEFKAWFEGFTENVKDTPTAKQWARIKARVAEIDGAYTPPQVFIDRYWYPYRYTYPSYPLYTPTSVPTWTSAGNTVYLANFTAAGKAENIFLTTDG